MMQTAAPPSSSAPAPAPARSAQRPDTSGADPFDLAEVLYCTYLERRAGFLAKLEIRDGSLRVNERRTYHFDEWDVAVWVRNAEEVVVSRAERSPEGRRVYALQRQRRTRINAAFVLCLMAGVAGLAWTTSRWDAQDRARAASRVAAAWERSQHEAAERARREAVERGQRAGEELRRRALAGVRLERAADLWLRATRPAWVAAQHAGAAWDAPLLVCGEILNDVGECVGYDPVGVTIVLCRVDGTAPPSPSDCLPAGGSSRGAR